MTGNPVRQAGLLRALTYLMFMTFAMTTDSVGVIIPQVIKRFSLGMTAGGSFQYATMSGISLAAIALGFLADRLGRKVTIVVGLLVFGISSGLFAAGHNFLVFVLLLFFGGVGIGVFKAGALALIGDLSHSTREHAATMNTVEGFFGVGAIIGPAIVGRLLQVGADWKWLYVIAAGLCAILVVAAATANYPPLPTRAPTVGGLSGSKGLRLLGDPFALAFGAGLMLYVAAEAAVYVWAPTYLAGYSGRFSWFALYAVSIFFVLRVIGRFAGARLLDRLGWRAVLAVCSSAVLLCFAAGAFGGRGVAAISLPLSGLFMSILYPTINSKGISCFPRRQHGAIAGVLLFFTCVSAVLAPLAMAVVSDAMGDPKYSLYLASLFAALLAALCLWNAVADPARARLDRGDHEDYLGEGVAAASA